MTTYTWPSSGNPFVPKALRWGTRSLSRTATSGLSGATQTVTLPGSRWLVGLDFANHTYAERAQLEAFFTRLNGQEHRISLWDYTRSRPRGSCNTVGVTLSTAAAQFASTLELAGCGVSTTLLAGDWLSLPTSGGNQLVQIAADALGNSSGAMHVEVRHMLRAPAANGAAVTLSQASALFMLASTELQFPRAYGNNCPEFSIDLIEAFT